MDSSRDEFGDEVRDRRARFIARFRLQLSISVEIQRDVVVYPSTARNQTQSSFQRSTPQNPTYSPRNTSRPEGTNDNLTQPEEAPGRQNAVQSPGSTRQAGFTTTEPDTCTSIPQILAAASTPQGFSPSDNLTPIEHTSLGPQPEGPGGGGGPCPIREPRQAGAEAFLLELTRFSERGLYGQRTGNFNGMQSDVTHAGWAAPQLRPRYIPARDIIMESRDPHLFQRPGVTPGTGHITSILAHLGSPINTTSPITTTTETQPEDPVDATLETATTYSSLEPVSHSCVLCTTMFQGKETIKVNFPFTCISCDNRNYCANCIKDWCVDACRNEAKMPPKCCLAIPLSVIAKCLSATELELFRAKHLEWSTADRLYCPVPSCSAFIPPRLYVEPTKTTLTSSLSTGSTSEEQKPALSPAVATKSSVLCPECGTSVCTKCRAKMHDTECAETDVDPALAGLLKKWKIKRCPKCRTGVRKVYGCTHVACRCGANFCFGCLLSIANCGGGCPEDEDDEEEEDEEDFDGRAGFFDGDGFEFGGEPQRSAADIWGCLHRWDELQRTGTEYVYDPHQQPECHDCFRPVSYFESESNPTINDHDNLQTEADTELGSTDSQLAEMPIPSYAEYFWHCHCCASSCKNCPKEAPAERTLDDSWMWKCNCGTECMLCDRDEAISLVRSIEAKLEEIATAAAMKGWSCGCGKVICGSCKSSVEN